MLILFVNSCIDIYHEKIAVIKNNSYRQLLVNVSETNSPTELLLHTMQHNDINAKSSTDFYELEFLSNDTNKGYFMIFDLDSFIKYSPSRDVVKIAKTSLLKIIETTRAKLNNIDTIVYNGEIDSIVKNKAYPAIQEKLPTHNIRVIKPKPEPSPYKLLPRPT
jgi:hypothetical protein